MASDEELRAMGIKKNENSKKYIPKQNNVANIIKAIGIIVAVIGIIAGLMSLEYLEVMSVVIIIACIISAVFVYALGEIIQLLEDIKNK